ncbi:MAG: bifunctional folylpolyglutamate synthase/dihydrofolate synthase [Planctomycetota bacterium]
MAIRNVDEALQALAQLTNYERTRPDGPRDFDLSRPTELLERLGSPHRELGARVVQVAGTKGKGSTARFVDSILRTAGLRTGRFLSPHLQSVRERIAVDGAWVEEAEFARHVEAVIDAVEGHTTFFEALLAAACLHFAERNTEAVVLEVGLGGRLDATTVVPATHTIITSLGLDHTEILGPTLQHIAVEKAGTIRFGVPVWSAVSPATPEGAIVRQIAMQHEAPFTYVPPPTQVEPRPDGLKWNERFLRVLGRHQAHNAALAAACCGDLDRTAIDHGLMAAEQPGCCELRGNVLLDGAHTPESVAATVQALHDHRPGVTPALVFALAEDKDLDAIAATLAPHVDRVVCTRADEKRGRDGGELAAHPAWADKAVAIEEPAAALDAAREKSPDLVLVTGSLYLAGLLRAHC